VKRKQTTIEDVAALAGVSRQTVSRVLNDRRLVAEETRARVLRAIDTLEYRPNASARSLASRRTYVLGILTADFSDYTHARIIEGAEAEARERGYAVFVSGATHGLDGEPLRSPLLSQHRAEGLFIVYHGSRRDRYAIFEDIPRDLPVVTIGYAQDRENVTTIGITNSRGAREATEHLLSLGHRRIAHVTGPADMYESQERRLAYAETLREAGITPEDSLVAHGDWSSASGYRATMELLDREMDFTAMFVQNDRMAMGVLQALRERDRQVPQDVAVVGFDDIPAARYFCPPLTTVRHPFHELGRTGIRLLAELADDQSVSSDSVRLETKLVVRLSCGAQNGVGPAHQTR
jgi:LacI family repressor for deo operon, udp, cdd, tsx, nupC, and nupG